MPSENIVNALNLREMHTYTIIPDLRALLLKLRDFFAACHQKMAQARMSFYQNHELDENQRQAAANMPIPSKAVVWTD